MKVEYHACDVCQQRLSEDTPSAVMMSLFTGNKVNIAESPFTRAMGAIGVDRDNLEIPEVITITTCGPKCAITYLMTVQQRELA